MGFSKIKPTIKYAMRKNIAVGIFIHKAFKTPLSFETYIEANPLINP